MLNLCLWIGNICNGLLLGNASIARGLTCCKKLARHEASRKSWSTKFPLGGGGKSYLASGLLHMSVQLLFFAETQARQVSDACFFSFFFTYGQFWYIP